MDHLQFEEHITDYLDHNLDRPTRRTFAEHLLACRPCHSLFNDVRLTIDACHSLKEEQMREIALFTEVEQRIINATTAGEMLSCVTLDALISDYFDGVIEATYEHIFKEHFAVCDSCHRLIVGVRQSIEEREQLEVPKQLYGRIYAATVGARRVA